MTTITIVLTSSQVWTCPAGVYHVDAIIVGGGGPGARGDGGTYLTSTDGKGSTGGGAGAQQFLSKQSVTPRANYTIVVGGSNADSSAFGTMASKGSTGSIGANANSNGTAGTNGLQTGSYPTAPNGGGSGAGSGGSGGSGWGAGGGGGAGAPWQAAGLWGSGGDGAPGVVIITYQQPDITMGVNPTTGKIVSTTFSFTGTATETPTAWLWDFGDGNTSTSQNPTHVYTAPGKKTVSLTVTNAYMQFTSTQADYVTVYSRPSAQGIIVMADSFRGV